MASDRLAHTLIAEKLRNFGYLPGRVMETLARFLISGKQIFFKVVRDKIHKINQPGHPTGNSAEVSFLIIDYHELHVSDQHCFFRTLADDATCLLSGH